MYKQILNNQNDVTRAGVFLRSLQFEKPVEIEIKPFKFKRSKEANKKMWAMLRDISKQVLWHGQKLKDESWKDIFSASLKGQQSAPGLDGELVFFGQRTRDFSIAMMSDMIELMYSFGAERGVVWSELVNGKA